MRRKDITGVIILQYIVACIANIHIVPMLANSAKIQPY